MYEKKKRLYADLYIGGKLEWRSNDLVKLVGQGLLGSQQRSPTHTNHFNAFARFYIILNVL